MAESLIGPKEYAFAKSTDPTVDTRKLGNKNYVLIKKSFFGRIKAVVQELEDYVEIVSYKTIKITIDELSDDDLYDLMGYFTKRRLDNQVDLIKKEIEFRKKLLVNPDAVRPDYLKNSLKIKYNIVKKVCKEKKYGSKKVKLPKKDFIFIYTNNRLLCDYINPKFGISFNIVFNIINAKEYMKHLKKYEKDGKIDETSLFEEIEQKLRSIIDSYLFSIDYEFKDEEDLLSDSELNNKIKLVCFEYGIEIPSIKIVLSKEQRLRQAGLSEERISLISAYDSSGEADIAEQKKREQEKELILMIKKLQSIGVEITDDGYFFGLADEIAREYGDIDESKFINITDLNNSIINEICRAYTSPLKIR